MKRLLAVAIAVLAVLAVALRSRAGAREQREPVAASAPADTSRARVRAFWERFRAATAYRTAGKLPEAAAAYREALALDPAHEDALYYLGNVEVELGGYAEAERAWRRLVEVNPRSDRGHGRLGELHLCLADPTWRDLSRAEADFQEALRINREQTGPLLRLGQIALVEGRAREAARYLAAVLGTNAGSGPAHYLSGYLAWKGGDSAAAARHYERAFATPEAPAKGSNEGDTKNDPPATLLNDPTCPVFQAHFASIAGPAGAGTMESNYRRLDELLARIR